MVVVSLWEGGIGDYLMVVGCFIQVALRWCSDELAKKWRNVGGRNAGGAVRAGRGRWEVSGGVKMVVWRVLCDACDKQEDKCTRR